MLFIVTPRSPISSLFPYTTLFRSAAVSLQGCPRNCARRYSANCEGAYSRTVACRSQPRGSGRASPAVERHREAGGDAALWRRRSEEHTSELQSPYDLVCRLLLEKK